MSRQTGECFAEVTFETQAGQFRCHWSQHKARKKANGNLVDSKHEISDAVSGQILESKKREVANAIESRGLRHFFRQRRMKELQSLNRLPAQRFTVKFQNVFTNATVTNMENLN
jgi:hypothetical protein